MIKRKELKANAKQMLKGRWGQAVTLNLVQSIPLMLSTWLLPLMVGAMMLVISHPAATTSNDNFSINPLGQSIFTIVMFFFSLGASFTLLDWLRGLTTPVGRGLVQVFTRRYLFAAIVLYVLQVLLLTLWALLLVIPAVVKQFSYAQTYFIMKDLAGSAQAEKLNYFDYITLSRKLMDGHKFDLFVLQLSMLGWAILAVLTLGIGFLWLVPYYKATMAAFYQKLVAERPVATLVED